MKRWIPLVAGVVLLFGFLAYWFVTNSNNDAQPGVQVAPQAPIDSPQPEEDESLKGLGEENEVDPEEISNTFEMSEEGVEFPDSDGPMGQEIDGAVKNGSQDVQGGLGSAPIETIDEDDGETIDPAAVQKGAKLSPQSQGSNTQVDTSPSSSPAKP